MLIALMWLTVGIAGAVGAEPPIERKLSPLSVRGVNYYPRQTPWGSMWTKTPEDVWGRDMAVAASLGVNTIRAFLQFSPQLEKAGLVHADGTPSPAYLAKIDALLAAAWSHGIRVIYCFEFSPDWLAGSEAPPRWQPGMKAVATRYRDDGRVLMWDLMNEPESPEKWTEATRTYLRQALPLIRQIDERHLTTVGLTWRIDRLLEVGLPDVVQYHEYCPKGLLFEKGPPRVIGTISHLRKAGGERPLIIGEFGMSSARDADHGAADALRAKLGDAPGTEAEQARVYDIVLQAAERERIAGVLAWCLYDYPIKNPNESHFGLVRGDGSLKPAAERLRETFARWKGN
jgi:endo-1,4-beta-mannosidase